MLNKKDFLGENIDVLKNVIKMNPRSPSGRVLVEDRDPLYVPRIDLIRNHDHTYYQLDGESFDIMDRIIGALLYHASQCKMKNEIKIGEEQKAQDVCLFFETRVVRKLSDDRSKMTFAYRYTPNLYMNYTINGMIKTIEHFYGSLNKSFFEVAKDLRDPKKYKQDKGNIPFKLVYSPTDELEIEYCRKRCIKI